MIKQFKIFLISSVSTFLFTNLQCSGPTGPPPVKPNKDYRKNISGPVISFIGTRNIDRDEYYKALTDAGFFPLFYGPGYNNEVIDREFATVCSSSDYMLSLNTHNISVFGASRRQKLFPRPALKSENIILLGLINKKQWKRS